MTKEGEWMNIEMTSKQDNDNDKMKRDKHKKKRRKESIVPSSWSRSTSFVKRKEIF